MLGERITGQKQIADERLEGQEKLFNIKHPPAVPGAISKSEQQIYDKAIEAMNKPNSRDVTFGKPLMTYQDARELYNTLKSNPTYSALQRAMAKSQIPAQESAFSNVINFISKYTGDPSKPIPPALQGQYSQIAQEIMQDSKQRFSDGLNSIEASFPNIAKGDIWKNIKSKYLMKVGGESGGAGTGGTTKKWNSSTKSWE
jgi:hypothetical protein